MLTKADIDLPSDQLIEALQAGFKNYKGPVLSQILHQAAGNTYKLTWSSYLSCPDPVDLQYSQAFLPEPPTVSEILENCHGEGAFNLTQTSIIEQHANIQTIQISTPNYWPRVLGIYRPKKDIIRCSSPQPPEGINLVVRCPFVFGYWTQNFFYMG
ncbi:MAG: hypothetical protein OSA77_02085 [Halioglobus sp.]|nr:hypothetical protein [Halioglobus sp.]